MKLPPDRTAIVLIEAQNDFLSPGGTMYKYIADQLAKRGVINNLKSLLDGSRGKVKIFYVPFQAFKPGFPELKPGGAWDRGSARHRDGDESRLGRRRVVGRDPGP